MKKMKNKELVKKGIVVMGMALVVALNLSGDVKAGNGTVTINSQGRFLYTDAKSGKSVLLDADDFKRIADQITRIDGDLTQIDTKINNLNTTVQSVNTTIQEVQSDVNIKVERWDADTQTLYLVPVE